MTLGYRGGDIRGDPVLCAAPVALHPHALAWVACTNNRLFSNYWGHVQVLAIES